MYWPRTSSPLHDVTRLKLCCLHSVTLCPATLQVHVAGLFDGKQRLFLRMFAFDSGELLHVMTHCE